MKLKHFFALIVIFFVFLVCSVDSNSDAEVKAKRIIYGTGYDYLMTEAEPVYSDAKLQEIFDGIVQQFNEAFNKPDLLAIGSYIESRKGWIEYNNKQYHTKEEIVFFLKTYQQKNIKDVTIESNVVEIIKRDWIEGKTDKSDLLFRIEVMIEISYDKEGASEHGDYAVATWFHPRSTWGGQ